MPDPTSRAAEDENEDHSSAAGTTPLAPALLSGAPDAALAMIQEALRSRLEQPRLLLRSDAFQRFHRITLVPQGPPMAIERPRRPYPEIELLTDGSGCWLRVVGEAAWQVDGIECVRSGAAPVENPPYTN